MNEDLQELITHLNYCALFVAALSGAAAGINKKADYFGVMVIAYLTACCGGITRDVLLGDHPPENIRTWQPAAIAVAASLVALLFFPRLRPFLRTHIQTFDAFGLGLFTVIGATKGAAYGVSPISIVFLGVITGVGGGMARDIVLARTPSFLHREIYATASLAGSLVVLMGCYWNVMRMEWAVVLGAGLCTVLRLVALHFNINMPAAWKNICDTISSRRSS